jgi:endonuclease/exonuclease/phosphatase family metal-dependent hydrolase
MLQSIEKTSEYRKWCFDTIVSTVEENKALKGDIVRLQELLQQVQDEQDALQTSVDEQRQLLDQEKRGI